MPCDHLPTSPHPFGAGGRCRRRRRIRLLRTKARNPLIGYCPIVLADHRTFASAPNEQHRSRKRMTGGAFGSAGTELPACRTRPGGRTRLGACGSTRWTGAEFSPRRETRVFIEHTRGRCRLGARDDGDGCAPRIDPLSGATHTLPRAARVRSRGGGSATTALPSRMPLLHHVARDAVN